MGRVVLPGLTGIVVVPGSTAGLLGEGGSSVEPSPSLPGGISGVQVREPLATGHGANTGVLRNAPYRLLGAVKRKVSRLKSSRPRLSAALVRISNSLRPSSHVDRGAIGAKPLAMRLRLSSSKALLSAVFFGDHLPNAFVERFE